LHLASVFFPGPESGRQGWGGPAAGGRSLNSLIGNRFPNAPRHQGLRIGFSILSAVPH